MSHTIVEKRKLLARVRRIKGQIEALERGLEQETGCEAAMHLIAGIRGSVSSLMGDILEDHVRTHLVDADKKRDPSQPSAKEQLVDVVHAYLR